MYYFYTFLNITTFYVKFLKSFSAEVKGIEEKLKKSLSFEFSIAPDRIITF